MGDPKRQRKKYSGPRHPWEKERIEEEKSLKAEYGFKNKKEIWKMRSLFKRFKNQAKQLIALKREQAEKEKSQLLGRLARIGLIQPGGDINAVLWLSFRSLLDRRLQTMLMKRGLARTVKQARQFIVHGHVKVSDKKITSPSYIVRVSEEPMISFSQGSSLSKADHPERAKESKENGKE